MTDEITPKEEVIVETPTEPVSEPETVISPEPQTAQIPVSEPLATPTESPSEIEVEPIAETIPEETKPAEPEIKSESTSEPIQESVSVKEETKPEIPEPVSEPIQTAQIPVNEPLAPEPKIKIEPKPVEQIPETKPEPNPTPEVISTIAIISKSKSLARELLVKARNMIQFRKRKKLDKIMTLFAKQTKITNDEVEKFLHVSDATAGRYLFALVKEGKIKQSGKTGKSVFYSKI